MIILRECHGEIKPTLQRGGRSGSENTAMKQVLLVSMDTASSLMQPCSIEKYTVGIDPRDFRLGDSDILNSHPCMVFCDPVSSAGSYTCPNNRLEQDVGTKKD